MRMIPKLIAAWAAVGLSACATVPVSEPQIQPPVAAAQEDAFVIAANPLAARAGREVLKRGGSAVDAAIAVQAMLSLVEPQSSGVGGGGFINYYDARSRKVSIYDGREVAPAQATSTMFLGEDGNPLPFDVAVLSGRATGVPGALAALKLAHSEHGRLQWSTLFETPRRTAADGFVVSPRLARLLRGDFAENRAPDVIAYFSQGPGGRLVDSGDRLKNPAYADFLQRLADQGINALYTGSTAARIVERTRQGPLPGSMTTRDLAGYKEINREGLCRTIRVYEI
jgi:gamma-glutamyltranspeptidase/glutathione hydrolase